MDRLYSYILGYVFAMIIAHPFIWIVVKASYKCIGLTKSNKDVVRPHAWQPAIVGFLERGLYVGALHSGANEFIGIWLILKVAGNWKRWSEDKSYADHFIAGRNIYNTFLIGNALSIAYSAVGYQMPTWIMSETWWPLSIVVPLTLMFGSMLLFVVIRWFCH